VSEATKTYRAVAEREDGWWLITVPELDIVTQARRVDQIEHMARDLIAVWLEVDYATVAVDVDVRVPAGWREEVQAAEKAQADAAAAAEAASAQVRRAARRLRAQGLTVRDVGYLLKVSPQDAPVRASDQLTRRQAS
jgi:glutamate dehydrogenase/leucine dehydrogenase